MKFAICNEVDLVIYLQQPSVYKTHARLPNIMIMSPWLNLSANIFDIEPLLITIITLNKLIHIPYAEIAFIANDVNINISASKDDLEICFVPSQFAQTSINDNTLIHVLPKWVRNSKPIYLLFPDRSYIPNRVKILKEYIVDYI